MELIKCIHQMHSGDPIGVANKRDFLNLFTESDYVAATMAGQIYEYEVKVSRKDFQIDRLKKRNRIYEGHLPGEKPNRFFYVTAPGIVTVEDIPSFAGWIEWVDGVLTTRREAPLLRRDPHPPVILLRLARAMRHRWRNRDK